MGGRIFTCVNGHKYEVIFGAYVVKFIRIQTGTGTGVTAKQGRLSRPQGDYLRATTPVNAHPKELKNYL